MTGREDLLNTAFVAGADCTYETGGLEALLLLGDEGDKEVVADEGCARRSCTGAGSACRCLRNRDMKPFKPGPAEAGGLGRGAGGRSREGSVALSELIAMGSARSARLPELLLPGTLDPGLLSSRG